MKKNVFGLLALVGAFLFAACSNPMIASGSSEDETAPTPVVRVVAAPTSYVIGESSSLIATVSGNGKGKVSYQWYKLTKNGEETSESAIEGADEDVYVSNEGTAGDYVYFVRVSNVLGNSIKTVDSDPVTITVKAKEEAKASDPVVVLATDKTVYAKGQSFKLVATASVSDGGTLTYQWYRNDEAIENATSEEYEGTEEAAGTYKYYVVVTNTLNNTTATKKSVVKTLEIVDVEKIDAVTPVFTKVLSAKQYKVNEEDPEVLSVKATVTDGGLVTYKWYLVEGEKETEVAGNVESYTPAVNNVGTFIYKVVATNNNAGATGKTTAEAYLSVEISVIDPDKVNAQAPAINTQPIAAEYIEGDTVVAPLSVTATSQDGGALTYQWYKDNAPIVGATERTYTPVVEAEGSATYYVVVKNTITEVEEGKEIGQNEATVTSDSVEIVVKPYKPEAPKFNPQPASLIEAELDSPNVFLFSVSATVSANAIVAYQWYQKDGDDEIALVGETKKALILDTSTAGTFKYFCRATATVVRNGKTYTSSADSTIATFKVTTEEILVDAVAPVISGVISDVSYDKDAQAADIDATATVTDGGVLSYQWYKLGSEWEAINGETNAKFNPSTATVGKVTYKVVITNTNENATGNKTAKTEKEVEVTVNAPAVAGDPVISAQPESKQYDVGATVTALSVTASSPDNGTLTYQWYKNDVEIEGANAATYTPSAAEAGVFNYKVVVTNTISNGSKATKASSVAIITVVDPGKRNAAVPTFTTDLSVTSVEYTVGATNVAALTVAASSTDTDATITYVWYKNGAPIEGATGPSYTPSAEDIGTFTYQVHAISTIPEAEDVGVNTASADSKVATIVVKAVPVINALEPVITTDVSVSSTSFVQGDELILSVEAESKDSGTLSYQWYDAAGAINGATAATYTVNTKVTGAHEYHVVVTNTIADNNDGGNKTAHKSSGTVNFTVSEFKINVPSVTVSAEDIKLGSDLCLTADVTNMTEGSTITSYKWYLVGSSNNEELINTTTVNTCTYTPQTAGNYVFFCNVIAKKTNGSGVYACEDSEAGVAQNITVTVSDWNAVKPIVSTNSVDAEYAVGATNVTSLEVSATVTDGGTLSYQWYKAGNASVEGVAIEGAVNASYKPATTSADNSYYYAKVTNTVVNGEVTKTNDDVSSRIHIQVTPQYKYAATPVIGATLVSATYKQGDEVTALDASATTTSSGMAVSGTITYQWYSNTTESTEGGEAISGATSATYTPSIAAVGTKYYYCVATNTIPSTTEGIDPDTTKHSASAVSTVAKIVVNQLKAKKPIASLEANKLEYTIGDEETVVIVSSYVFAQSDDGDVGTITYQWYEVDGETLTAIEGATGPNYTVPTNVSVGEHSYTVRITNTVATNTAATSDETTSKTITITSSLGDGGITIDFN